MNSTNKKGFTLIELLVVIAIIGILSTIGLVALNGARGKARDAKRAADIRQYALAWQSYADTNGGPYTGTGAAIGADPSGNASLKAYFGASVVPPSDPQQTAAPTLAGTCVAATVDASDAACRFRAGFTGTPRYFMAHARSGQYTVAAYFETSAPGNPTGAGIFMLNENGAWCTALNTPTTACTAST